MNELKRIYTSSFKNVKGCDELQTVNLSRHPPKWFNGVSYPKFYPPRRLIKEFRNHEITSLEYTTVFIKDVLNKYDTFKVLTELLELGPGRDIILCCWGGCHDYCHRHLVASWLNTYLIRNPGLTNIPYIREITLKDCYHVDHADYDYNKV